MGSGTGGGCRGSRAAGARRLSPRRRTALLASVAAIGLAALRRSRAARCTFDPAGLTLRSRTGVVRVTALDDAVIRVRAGGAALPEDASWAVLPEVRAAGVAVVPVRTGHFVGFDTRLLRVRVDRRDGAVSVHDHEGRLVSADVSGAGPAFAEGGFALRRRLRDQEEVFGLGDKAGPIGRRGGSFTLWNTDAYGYGEGGDPLYKAIPFLMGVRHGAAYGLLLDNGWRTTFDVGRSDAGELRIGADGGPLDYYVLHGPDPRSVLRCYAWLTGPAPLPPSWAFGFQQSRYSYMSAAEVRTVAARFRSERIPADVLWLDIDYQDHNRPFTVDARAFPDLPGLLAELRGQGFRTVLIADMHVPVRPDAGYAPYDQGVAGDHFLRESDGSPYVGPVWPGPCVFPDFTRAATRAWWGGLYRAFCDAGAAGFWDDMNEPSVFDTATRTIPLDVWGRVEETGHARRRATQREAHNLYGLLNARATHDGLLRLRPAERPFVMTRAGYAGVQRYAVTWTGDNSSTWNHLRLSTPMLLSLGLSGVPFGGADLGGFAGAPSPALLTRWLQLGMFNPISRDHTDKNTPPQEPWVHGEPHVSLRREAIEARYRLLPYIYTLAEEASRTGVPMMRPLFLEFPGVGGAWTLDHLAPTQFMWGDALMVAPAPHGESSAPYPVLLPPGDWYDYWTGRLVTDTRDAEVMVEGRVRPVSGIGGAGLRLLQVVPRLEVLPVYVRAGAIVPRHGVIQSTAEVPQGPLELHVYPAAECHGSLYVDDGLGHAHRDGGYLRCRYRGERSSDGLVVREERAEGRFEPWWGEIAVILHDVPPPAAADGWRYDPAARSATIVVDRAALRRGISWRPGLDPVIDAGPGSGRSGA